MKCCPLIPAWATTIHKFQDFKAGFHETDIFNHLICNPGDFKWEQTCPGALYTTLSRAKTMGTANHQDDHPKDSAIFWRGSGISENRILEGALKNARKRGDPKERSLLINKREDWVNHLRRAGEATKKKQYTKGTKNKLKSTRFTQNQVAAGISSIITEPNMEWYKLKRSQYVMEKTFFGLCTSC